MRADIGRDYWVTVCDQCGRASCWHGDALCGDSLRAGTKMVRASELRSIGAEHPNHYSRRNLLRVCGEVVEVESVKQKQEDE